MKALDTNFVRDRYNVDVHEKFEDNYEFKRWFRSKRSWLDYYMTHQSIVHHLSDITFKTCFELGPGPGTWTRLLYRSNPQANFKLLDISTEMKHQFELEMRTLKNINYTIGDFLQYDDESKYDLFFSSRAFEYIPDKKLAIRKIYNMLNYGGKCLIITKNPHFRTKQTSNDILHSSQISSIELSRLLDDAKFTSIKNYPVVIRIPIVDKFRINISKRKFISNYSKSHGNMSRLVESYITVCKKQ